MSKLLFILENDYDDNTYTEIKANTYEEALRIALNQLGYNVLVVDEEDLGEEW